ncbi:hypothetical protein P7C70_g7330, partial [Phenoliferia sp. Uapishka_3]
MTSIETTISSVLGLVPIPALSFLWQVGKATWDKVQATSDNKKQLTELVKTFSDYFLVLKELSPSEVDAARVPINALKKALDKIQEFVEEEDDKNWLKRAFQQDATTAKIAALHRRLLDACAQFNVRTLTLLSKLYQPLIFYCPSAFQIRAHVDAAQRQKDMAKCADEDHQITHNLLSMMIHDFNLFEKKAEIRDENMMMMLVVLRKELADIKIRGSDTSSTPAQATETQFLETTIRTMQRRSGRIATPLPDWTVTSFEIERGASIGQGGYSNVFRGRWRGQVVALKFFKDKVSENIIEKEAELWARLRHDNLVPLYGASIYETQPFMIMPLCQNGTVTSYIQNYPSASIAKLVNDVALGVNALHCSQVIHGDLKGDNVLVDASGTAKLSDFGLSTIKRHLRTTSATVMTETQTHGSLRWSSPERIKPGRLTMPGDIYSFAVTVWEMYSNEVPFDYMDDGQIQDYIYKEGGRPERTDRIPDIVWTLIESCWQTAAASRPVASAVCATTLQIFEEEDAVRELTASTQSLALDGKDAETRALEAEMARLDAASKELKARYDEARAMKSNTSSSYQSSASSSTQRTRQDAPPLERTYSPSPSSHRHSHRYSQANGPVSNSSSGPLSPDTPPTSSSSLPTLRELPTSPVGAEAEPDEPLKRVYWDIEIPSTFKLIGHSRPEVAGRVVIRLAHLRKNWKRLTRSEKGNRNIGTMASGTGTIYLDIDESEERIPKSLLIPRIPAPDGPPEGGFLCVEAKSKTLKNNTPGEISINTTHSPRENPADYITCGKVVHGLSYLRKAYERGSKYEDDSFIVGSGTTAASRRK